MVDWQYGTHAEVLERVLEKLKPERAIEHGSGEYSTPLLCRYAGHVVCVESNPDFMEAAADIIAETEYEGNEDPLGLVVEEWDDLTDFDFALVDGKPEEREAFARDCFKAGVPVIIWHDTEPAGMGWYGYQNVKVPQEYRSIRWRHREGKRKGTTLFWKVDLGYPERWKIEGHDRA